VMSRDIVDGCVGTSLHFLGFGLVAAGGVDGEFSDELAGFGVEDSDV
jgi:hypothetical protein